MSLHSHDLRGERWSRRGCLKWAAAAVAAWPVASGAGCPCSEEEKTDAAPAPAPAAKALRVCADPNNLPFSNRKQEGFEDRIAALVARELGLPLEFDWLPQRLGFYRTALKTFDSNLVMAAPGGFEKALITEPYYRSTYVFVFRKDAAAPIRSFDDAALRTLKVGVTLTGGANTPPTHALAKRKIIDNVTGFTAFDESEGKPGERIIAAVAGGEIDVAIAWGPQAGYFAKRQSVELEVVPVSPTEDVIGDVKLPFSFEICMALRRPDKELRGRINEIIVRRQAAIDRILDEYFVPRLPLETAAHAGTGFEGKAKDAK
ncbi:MAG: quinoprotein dehydrogenase-associated probable transporter substrate-binding protein [Phycisphaerales bacterium]|nr:quinoprotein dehydrogenase-associated probable transporter substrate-binding protein [Phycisphaerales bacterium]